MVSIKRRYRIVNPNNGFHTMRVRIIKFSKKITKSYQTTFSFAQMICFLAISNNFKTNTFGLISKILFFLSRKCKKLMSEKSI